MGSRRHRVVLHQQRLDVTSRGAHRADVGDDGYDAAQEYEVKSADGGFDRMQVRAAKNPVTGSFFGADKYQLVSAGEDGVFGTDDDVKSYDGGP